MRNDAIRRSREMYRNSMVNTSHYSQSDKYCKDKKVSDENISVSSEKVNNRSGFPENPVKIFDGKLDGEKLTIIALMVILAKEGADMKLILALGYILM